MVRIRQATRPAVHRDAFPSAVQAGAWPRRVRKIEIKVIRNEQIQMTVEVVINETASSPPARSCIEQSGFFGYVRKRPIAVIAVEHVLAEGCDEQILGSIVVVIAN